MREGSLGQGILRRFSASSEAHHRRVQKFSTLWAAHWIWSAEFGPTSMMNSEPSAVAGSSVSHPSLSSRFGHNLSLRGRPGRPVSGRCDLSRSALLACLGALPVGLLK